MTTTDSAITNPLETLRGLIRRYVLIDGLLTAALFALAWYWLGLAVDYGLFKLSGFDWVLDAPKLLRVLALSALAIVLFGILFTRLFLRLSKELSYPALALVLEKRFPKILGDRLITAVELSDIEKAKRIGFSEAMVQQTIAEAEERVKQVPVRSVFNWRRLRMKAVLVTLVTLGTFAAVFGVTAAIEKRADFAGFWHGYTDVSAIWAERNLLLRNTPWPRNAYLELVDFPGDELRVGRDAQAPVVRVRAARWVIADSAQPHGWRPANTRDLKELIGRVAGKGEPWGMSIDQWETQLLTDEHRAMFEKLESLAASPGSSRTFRKLAIPDAVTLHTAGAKTSGKVSLNREADNTFTGKVEGLKESVRFTVRGGDFRTLPKSITLVPPPQFQKLGRTEYQPAYLHYPAPVTEPTKPADIVTLKGLKQRMPENALSLTGDKTVFTIVAGTEFELTGLADKPLQSVSLRPKVGPLPGRKAGDATPVTYEPEGTGRDGFTIPFRGTSPTATTEFDIVLKDDDGVETVRTMLVQVTDDQAPQVELTVSGFLRKQGNAYLVTPVAVVPFQFDQNETKVKDDHALWRAEFAYSVAAVESGVVLAVQAQALAGMIAYAPLMPSIADAFTPAASALITMGITKASSKEAGAVPVPRFVEQYAGLRKETLDALKRKLGETLPADASQAIKEVKFINVAQDVFDLKTAIPKLAASGDSADFNQRYRVELNLVATDANVESGPKTGQNLEPIRLIVVSEADLLAEISKDEELQAARLDDVLKRLKDALGKLNQTADRLVSPSVPPDQITAAAVRAQDIAQDVQKSREITTGVVTEYRRLHRECEFNRVRPEQIALFAGVIKTLDGILEKSFGDAEAAHGQVQGALAEGRRPDEALFSNDRLAMTKLIADIDELRRKIGETVDLNSLRNNLSQLHKKQVEIGRILKQIKEVLVGQLYLPEIQVLSPIEMNVGETRSVKHAINWKAYVGGAMTVRIAGPGEAVLKTPAAVPLPEDKDDFEYAVTAGKTPGEYKLTLTPTVGRPVEVVVRVK